MTNLTRCALLFAVLIGLCTCSDNQDGASTTDSMLTLATWIDDADGGRWTFNANGTYRETYTLTGDDKLQLDGTWKWISDTEISFVGTEITINGETHPIDKKPDNTIFQITEISKENLTVKVKNNAVGETFEFTTAKTFKAHQ